jgi:hypothetical protein
VSRSVSTDTVDDMSSPLRASLRTSLKTAMRSGDRTAVNALRSVISALDNAEAVPEHGSSAGVVTSAHVAGAADGVGAGERPRRELTTEDELAVIARETAELRASAGTLSAAGQQARADELVRAAELVEETVKG